MAAMVFCRYKSPLLWIHVLTEYSVLPESPRWLIAHGKKDQALVVLEWITPTSEFAQNGGAAVEENVQSQNGQISEAKRLFDQIVGAHELEQAEEGKFSFVEMFHGGKMQNWRRMALCVAVMAFQQLSG